MSTDDPWEFDEHEVDAFLAEHRKVDFEAAELLRGACADVLGAAPPQPDLTDAAGSLRQGVEAGDGRYAYFGEACGWRRSLPAGDEALWLAALASTMSPDNDPGTEPEEQAVVAALLHADWFGMVVGLFRRGVNATLTAAQVLRDIDQSPEIDDDSDDIGDDKIVLMMATDILTPRWQTLEVLSEERALSQLGYWGLPNALYRVWTGGEAVD